MYISGEARWFLRGTASVAAQDWITAGAYTERQDERTDQYLVLPDCECTGIKIRQGNFEVKARTSPSARITWTENIAGSRATWVKWSSSALDLQALTSPPAADETWLSVTKRRSLRLFSLETGSPVEVAPGGPWLPAGCMVETTDIELSGEAWWSFCCEAFGAADALLGHLDSAIRLVATDAPDLLLPPEASMSYPAWLTSRLV